MEGGTITVIIAHLGFILWFLTGYYLGKKNKKNETN